MNKIFKIISSVKITVVCLFLLFVLTFWGTVAQVEHGLYAAQERYFNSFFFGVFGVIPFPGAQMVLWVMFFNLVASGFTHLSKMKGWNGIGLKISHFGVLLYFVAAFITLHCAHESHVHLMEGEGTNVSASYHEWEISMWKETGNTRQVTAIDVGAKPGKTALGESYPVFSGQGMRVYIAQFYPNAKAYKVNDPKFINGSGIGLLEPKPYIKDREKNMAGIVIDVYGADNQQYVVLLYSMESRSTALKINGQTVYFQLRHKRFPLPFTIMLKDFKAKFHPGTQTAKSFESTVEVIKPGAVRDVRIFMNNPLRDKDFTFYQASYDIDATGREYSTFAVVQNAGQVLPYVACFVVFFGLALHFIMAALRRKRS